MAANEFQKDYIAYLEEENQKLTNKMMKMKESMDSRILNKDSTKNVDTLLEEILNVCTAMPENIDILFEHFTATMSLLRNILIQKSQMAQLAKKITQLLHPLDEMDPDFDLLHSKSFPSLAKNTADNDSTKKRGTAKVSKVSPMIKGHVISTAPRIQLNRVSQNASYFRTRVVSESPQLSPIIESSPITPVVATHDHRIFREVRIPLQRLDLNSLSNFTLERNIEDSPKSGYTGKGETLKRDAVSVDRLSRVTEESAEHSAESESASEAENNVEEDANNLPEVQTDPLEGPSWLLDGHPKGKSAPSSSRRSSYKFVNFKRPKCRSLPPLLQKDSSELAKPDTLPGFSSVIIRGQSTSDDEIEKAAEESLLEEACEEEPEQENDVVGDDMQIIDCLKTNCLELTRADPLDTSDMEITEAVAAFKKFSETGERISALPSMSPVLQSNSRCHSPSSSISSLLNSFAVPFCDTPDRKIVEESLEDDEVEENSVEADKGKSNTINIQDSIDPKDIDDGESSDSSDNEQNCTVNEIIDKTSDGSTSSSGSDKSIKKNLKRASEMEASADENRAKKHAASSPDSSSDDDQSLATVRVECLAANQSPLNGVPGRAKRRAAIECMRQKCWIAEKTPPAVMKSLKKRRKNKSIPTKAPLEENKQTGTQVIKKSENNRSSQSEGKSHGDLRVENSRATVHNTSLRPTEIHDTTGDEGRKRRKAAPGCLKEPALNQKLRRN